MPRESMPMPKYLLVLLFIISQPSILFLPSPALSKTEHLAYFPNTVYELNVYKIKGKKAGPTLMLIGGIQGNEPGGFLSADLYADMSLEKGNLIVVPRSNFYSILLNHRGPHGDMNRKFAHEENSNSMEDKIVSILKKLIEESDYLLNLHDGSGYYYPEYVDKWRNPLRFGQSIIADYEEYTVPETGFVIKLGEMARKVIAEVNGHIKNDLYRFHFNNTRTGDPDSPHKEQTKSATYYALTKHHIPAFGVETSKFLPTIDLKVRYHNLAINAFMKLFDIIPEHPGIALDPPVLKYLVMAVNGQTPTVVKDKQSIHLNEGDFIHISHIEANYERGLSLDILGYGDMNDFRKYFAITHDTSLIVRKDNHKFAEIPIKISKGRNSKGSQVTQQPVKIQYLVVQAKGHRILLMNGETLDLVAGDHMKIVDVLPACHRSSGIKVNFKGFVGDWENNTGEDRGYDINTGTGLMNRYSLYKTGKVFEILVSWKNKLLARFFVRINPPILDYVILSLNGRSHNVLRSGDTIFLSPNDEILLEEIRTNMYLKSACYLSIGGHNLDPGEKRVVKTLLKASTGKQQYEAIVKKEHIILGKILVNLKQGAK